MATTVETPIKFKRLWEASRYKVLYGGRGGAKSWNVARTLLIMGRQKPIRVLCTRELQISIIDSVHKLLSDQIVELNLTRHYSIKQATIVGANGTEFSFAGLRHNTNKIKSFEGIDIVWAEEAATITKSSWDLLVPTIRKPGSEIWMTFNPELETDETYRRFVLDPPSNAILIPASWRDNPWFPAELDVERRRKKETDPKGYRHIWEGDCMSALEGAIYEEEITSASDDDRITSLPYDKTKPVFTFWDLGHRDNTAIWFVQKDNQMYNVIDFYQDSRKTFSFYLSYIQSKGYVLGDIYLPHDGNRVSYDTGKSPQDRAIEAGFKVQIVPRTADKVGSLENVRALFSRLRFDENKTFDGVQALRRYRWGEGTGRTPVHDVHSHAADALATFGDASFVQWETYVETGGRSKMLHDWEPLDMELSRNGKYEMVGA